MIETIVLKISVIILIATITTWAFIFIVAERLKQHLTDYIDVQLAELKPMTSWDQFIKDRPWRLEGPESWTYTGRDALHIRGNHD